MLFKDRLEIRNPGQLPSQLSIEDLKKDHSSHPKNPLIADAFYFTRYIERMGTGIQDMTRRCLEYGLPEPEIKIQDGFVAIIYRKKGLAFDKVNNDNVPEKVTEKGTEKGTEKITKNQLLMLNAIFQNPHITSDELSIIVGIRSDKIRVNLSKLKTKGLLERIGPDKGGYWKVI